MLHPRAVGKEADRQPGIVNTLEPKRGARLFIIGNLDPLEWYVTALQEVTNSVGLRRATLAKEADSGTSVHDNLGDRPSQAMARGVYQTTAGIFGKR